VCPIITPWAITTNPGVFFNFPFLKSLSSLEFQLILQIAQVFDDFFGPLPGKLCTVSTGVVMVKGVFFFGTIFLGVWLPHLQVAAFAMVALLIFV